MSDEQTTFRPQRREPPSEANLQGEVGGANAQLDDMASMRAQFNQPSNDGFEQPTLPSGNIPAPLRQAMMRQQRQVSADQEGYLPPPAAQERRPQKPRPQADTSAMGTVGNPQGLANILAGIAAKTGTYEEIRLPSLGKFYDGIDGPRDGKIEVRPMTGSEEQILATSRYVKKGDALDMIFRKCLNGSFDTREFLAPDRIYLLLYLRGISYTPEYDVEVKCPHCATKFNHTIDLNELAVEECPEDYGPEALFDRLPTTGLEFRYRLATGADDKKVQGFRERRLKHFDRSGQADDSLTYRSRELVLEIGNGDDVITDKHEIQRVLESLPLHDVSYIRSVTSEPPFGVDTKVEIGCPSCSQDFDIQLPMDTGFFFPRANRKSAKTAA